MLKLELRIQPEKKAKNRHSSSLILSMRFVNSFISTIFFNSEKMLDRNCSPKSFSLRKKLDTKYLEAGRAFLYL